AMADTDRAALLAQPDGQAVGDIDRAVAAPSAANGDGEIGFALAFVAWQERREPGAQPIEKRHEIRVARNEFADRRILAGERPQRRDIVGIAQEPNIENEIRVARQSVPI